MGFLVEMSGIHKMFYGVPVLRDVSFTLRPGTVHALMGENGAGKSTLMKTLAGIYKPESGSIKIDDREVQIESPHKARELGIAMIHQELSPVAEMSVAENIFLAREPGRFGFVDYKSLYKQTEALLEGLNIAINPKVKMRHLRVADQQMVEIAKAISQDARIVIMDEPTSSITDKEVDSLFRMIQDMKAKGAGIVYISHKTDEIMRVASEITVLRDGRYVNTWPAGKIDMETVICSMVGRKLNEQFPKITVDKGEPILEVSRISRKGQFEDISFTLHRGEILGFVGLVGAGRTELMRCLFGMTRPDCGVIRFNGQKVEFKSPKEAIAKGIAYVTEDRKGEGLVAPMSVHHNTTLSSLRQFLKNGLIQKGAERVRVQEQIQALHIKVSSHRQPVKSLSGGNQQKVVLAKWMITRPNIIIFDEPTRGIDVGAKAEIYRIMCDFVARGNAVLMVSSEMPEAMGMADRIIVMSDHKYSGMLQRDEFSEEKIARMQFRHM